MGEYQPSPAPPLGLLQRGDRKPSATSAMHTPSSIPGVLGKAGLGPGSGGWVPFPLPPCLCLDNNSLMAAMPGIGAGGEMEPSPLVSMAQLPLLGSCEPSIAPSKTLAGVVWGKGHVVGGTPSCPHSTGIPNRQMLLGSMALYLMSLYAKCHSYRASLIGCLHFFMQPIFN